MYVFKRWQAIADDHAEGEAIDEVAHDARWDECTARAFDKIRDDIQQLIAQEIRRKRMAAFVSYWSKTDGRVKTVLKGLAWVFMRAWEGFVGAIGLLLFGLLFVWLAPEVAREIRSAMDQTLPVQTRPEARAPPAGENQALTKNEWVLRDCNPGGSNCRIVSRHPGEAECDRARAVYIARHRGREVACAPE